MKKLKKLIPLVLATTLLTSNVYAEEVINNENNDFNTSSTLINEINEEPGINTTEKVVEAEVSSEVTIIDKDGIEHTLVNNQATNNRKQIKAVSSVSSERVYISDTSYITYSNDLSTESVLVSDNINNSNDDLVTILDKDSTECILINNQPSYTEPAVRKQTRGISDNRVYTSGTNIITNPDDYGNVPNLSTYMTFNAAKTIATGKNIELNNVSSEEITVILEYEIPVQIPSVNGGYTMGTQYGYTGLQLEPNWYGTISIGSPSLVGITTADGQQITYGDTSQTVIRVSGWQMVNTNYSGEITGYKNITCSGNKVYVEPKWTQVKKLIIEQRNVVHTDNKGSKDPFRTYTTLPLEGYYVIRNEWGYVYDTVPASNPISTTTSGSNHYAVYIDYVKGPSGYLWPNQIYNPFYSTNSIYYAGWYYYYVDSTYDSQYTTIEAQLFYDLNRDGIRQANESIIDDPDESKKIVINPFTQAGYTDNMFYDKANLKVKRAGQVYATYTGTKYKVTPKVAGVTITPANIGKAEIVKVPAPVFVYVNVSGKLFYDTDRNQSYVSTYDKYANGTLVINHTLDGVVKTETINVTNGNYNISKIESGTYDYTFTPSDNANLVSKTGKITIAPISTPNTQGISTCTVDIPLQVQNQITIQGYYDNNYSNTYDSGDTLINNTAVVYHDTLNTFTTTNKVINVWNVGKYTVKSLNSMQPKDVYHNKDISFDITTSKLQSGNAETIYIGYRQPAEIKGTIVNQWGTPIANSIVTYNSYSVTTDSNGNFTLYVPYTVGSKDVVATQTNYTNVAKSLILNPKNNLGTMVQNKNFYTVTGTAKDINGKVIPNVVVRINDKSTTTNSNGVYTMDMPYSKPIIKNIEAEHNNYFNYNADPNIVALENNTYNIKMESPTLSFKTYQNLSNIEYTMKNSNGVVVSEGVIDTQIICIPGTYTITFTKENYQTVQLEVNINTDGSYRLNTLSKSNSSLSQENVIDNNGNITFNMFSETLNPPRPNTDMVKIIYNINNGTNKTNSEVVRQRIDFVVPNCPFKYDSNEKVFTGWNTEPNGSGITYKVGDITSWDIPADKSNTITLYAQWQHDIVSLEGKLFYDTDRNEKYSATNDKYSNGTLVIKHTLDGVQKTETINVKNGIYSINKIESGIYEYTFAPTDTINLVSNTGQINVFPTSTPEMKGTAKCNLDIPLDVQATITVQGYYDNNYNNIYDSGDTLIDNSANISHIQTGNYTTSNKEVNVYNTVGDYTINSLNNMADKDVYYGDKITFNITVNELLSGVNKTVYVGYRPPAVITGNIINQWGTPISNTTVAYNGYDVKTDVNGDFILYVPYSEGSKNVVATQTNYSKITKALTLYPKNNLGVLVQNKEFYTVTGTARDVKGNVISNATVKINGVSTKTNSEGVYSINIPYAAR